MRIDLMRTVMRTTLKPNRCNTGHLPFDEVLDRTVTALREQSLVSEQTIAERRRNVPSQVRNLLVDLLERQRAAEVPLNQDEPSMDFNDDFCECPIQYPVPTDILMFWTSESLIWGI
jgi:hypothetical protein